MAGYILVVDHQIESGRQLRFLLSLGGYQFVVAHTVAEAENWLTRLQNEVKRFDVMLVNNVEKKLELVELFNLSHRFSERLAVLLVERSCKLSDLLSEVSGCEHSRFYSCSPGQIIARLRIVLDRRA